MKLSIQQLATNLNNKYRVSKYSAWEKGDKKRIYIKGVGYNTKKMSTDAYIDLGGNTAILRVYIQCPSQHPSWIDSQKKEIIEAYALEVRYCRRYFDFNIGSSDIEAVMHNATLAAEPVKGYFTEWRQVRVKINSYGKLATRNRQFIVPFSGTKDSAPRNLVQLTEKGFDYLKSLHEQVLEPYTTAPDYNALADQHEQWLQARQIANETTKQILSDQHDQAEDVVRANNVKAIADAVDQGMTILDAWKHVGCPHPAPAEVAEAKKASGLTWKAFIETIN